MTVRILKIAAENKLESYGSINEVKVIPRRGEFINILANRFKVNQLEWFPLNDEVFIYIEDVPVSNE